MKSFKLLLMCSALVLAGCGDQGDAGKTEDKAEGGAPVEQAQDMASQAADEAQQAATDAGAAMEQSAETVQQEAATAGEAADAAGMAEQAVEAGSAAVEQAESAAAGDAGNGAPTAVAADLAAGQSVYQSKCLACHATGAAGAPKMGDKAAWEPRIAQGMDILVKHAIEGFKGAKGYMPPKGGFSSLSDDEVKSAVAYMVKETS